LLVIPFHHGRDDLRRCPELVELLREEVARGSEIVLHGYTHARAGCWRGDQLTVARAALFAREVAEFASLEWPEQRARLIAGREILAACGLETTGFCPPGWLHTAELPDLLRELGFTYLVEMLFLLDVQLRRRLVTPWMGFMGTSRFHEELAQLGAHLLAPWRTRARLVSVFLHPQGAPRSLVCQRVLRELAQEFERGGVPLTYGEAIRSS
jgi:predicted deacetylase